MYNPPEFRCPVHPEESSIQGCDRCEGKLMAWVIGIVVVLMGSVLIGVQFKDTEPKPAIAPMTQEDTQSIVDALDNIKDAIKDKECGCP